MEDITTEDLVMMIVDVFEQMLMSLYKAGKKVIFNGMWWNHDRFTEKKEFDPYKTPAMIIYRFLQKIVEDTWIKINILRDKANEIKSGKIKYIFMHGDSLSPVEVNRRAMAAMEDWFYIVIVSWDKHHFEMKEISDDVMWIITPALAWKWKFDESIWVYSQPWAIFFKENSDWELDILLKRLK